jgi:hypothetical protein
LRAQRTAPHLSQDETALLLQINGAISPDVQRRFNDLVAKRQMETISPAELTELIQITDVIEQQDAQRLAALIALAQLNGTHEMRNELSSRRVWREAKIGGQG